MRGWAFEGGEWGWGGVRYKTRSNGVRGEGACWGSGLAMRNVDSQTRSSTLRPRHPSQNLTNKKNMDRIQIRTPSLQERNQKGGNRFIDGES